MHSKIQSYRILDKYKKGMWTSGSKKNWLPVFSPLKTTIIPKQSEFIYTVQ